ncbi:MAG: hypothetical protein WC126_08015 [Proteiniphilum sp.]
MLQYKPFCTKLGNDSHLKRKTVQNLVSDIFHDMDKNGFRLLPDNENGHGDEKVRQTA